MIEQMKAIHNKQRKTKCLLKAVGFGLPASAVIAACCICFFSKIPIPIENPEILVFASFFMFGNFKSKPSIETIQIIMGFYLIAVLVNQLSLQYFQMSFPPINLSISFSFVVLSLCAIGFVVGKIESADTPDSTKSKDLVCSWLMVLGIIITHMALLVLLLNRFYGFGYDRNFSVLGNLCLYFLLFIFLWGKLNKLRFRQGIGVILAIFFFADHHKEVAMINKETTLRKDAFGVVGKSMNSGWRQTVTIILTGIAIIASAFHFWPFEDSKTWQILNFSNLSVLLWSLLLVGLFSLDRDRKEIISLLPHLSVFAYISVNILSVAFASDLGRTANFTIKLVLTLVGGYTLFGSAISSTKLLRLVYGLTNAAVIISLSYCFLSRFAFGTDEFGFYGNPYKYGTYTGMLIPLCGGYFFTSSKSWKSLLGAVIVIAAFASSGSLGALAAISVGMLAATILFKKWHIKLLILGSTVFGIGLLLLLNSYPDSAVQDDIKLAEKDGINLKQRYIEWQAEINLLEERTITGAGAGCINDYRSNFYYHLPKLNTLKAFDQNGWLATGAETGILGLVCFCWIMMYYGKLALSQATKSVQKTCSTAHRFAKINFIGLIATCAANLFSSVHYNGILIVFVLVLVLISRTNQLFGER